MADNFFEDKKDNPEDTGAEIEKIKVGEDEYTQDELSKLVGLGKIGMEAEEKFDTKLDRVFPEFTKKSQQIKEYEKKMADLEEKAKKFDEVEKSKNQTLTPEQRESAKKELYELMGGQPMTQAEFDNMYLQRRSAEKLLEDTQAVIDEAIEEKLPTTDVNKLLDHMKETGIRNPKKAYKDMFESELDRIKEEKFRKAKPSSYTTEAGSTAGGKRPDIKRPTRDTLGGILKDHFSQG